MGIDSAAPQRDSLRFCKAFFEVRDGKATLAALAAAGAESLQGDETAAPAAPNAESWYWWSPLGKGAGGPFLLRLRAARLILEGPTPADVASGWRELDRLVQPHAQARVAAGDELNRFLPRSPRHAGDRPETWSRAHESRVLAEFYAAFSERWANRPHPRLEGLSPRQAMQRSDLRSRLEEILARLDQIETQRRDRGQPSFAVDELRRALAETTQEKIPR